ncbi:hypothetical protein K3495_g14550, partial [Podosphaera aphanis]
MSNTYGVPVDSLEGAFSTPTTSPSRENMPPPVYDAAPPTQTGQAGPATLPPQAQQTSVILLPSSLWSLPYLTHSNEILNAAVQANAVRVGELFASSASTGPTPLPTSQPMSAPPTIQPAVRIPAPRIAEYDGSKANLRSFCSLLVNQIQGFEDQFPDEMAKVRYAYQCLGPAALVKM